MWQELYRLTYRYLKGLGLTHEDAEDLAQETLVTAYLHLDEVRTVKLKAWLFTVARHKYIDWLHRTKKEVALVNFSAEELADGAGGAGGSHAQRRGTGDNSSRDEPFKFLCTYSTGT